MPTYHSGYCRTYGDSIMSIEELLASSNPYAADQIAWEMEMEFDRLERSAISGDWVDVFNTREISSQQISELINMSSKSMALTAPDPSQLNIFA